MMSKTLVVDRWVWAIMLLFVSAAARAEVPKWVVYPDEEWRVLTPEEAGITDVQAWNSWVRATGKSAKGTSVHGEDHSGKRWGVALARAGYLVQTFGDPDYKYQTASVGKCFTIACLQLAIDEGRIKSADDLIKDYWTGEGHLDARHKYLDQGHHVFLTFNHLKTHRGAFPITNGWSWKSGKNYGTPAAKWSKWTGDPDKDNYAHAKPGTVGSTYSSGGYWRLAQALTAVWRKDLKQVLDERIMSHIGISADRWDWTPGQVVRENKDWYPKMPGYGGFLDPPYKIDGQIVRGAPGWAVISAKDLARWGLLVASGGQWKGKRLISRTQGHVGGNGSHAGRGMNYGKEDSSSPPWTTYNDPQWVLDRARGAGIDLLVIFPISNVRYKQANEEIAGYVRQHPGRLIGFAKHDPKTEAGSIRELLVYEVRELGLKGLKLHAVPTPEILKVVEELRIPILMHPPRVGDCLEVVRDHSQINFILAHLGSFASRDWREHLQAIQAAERYSNLHLDTSAVVFFSYLQQAARELPAEQLLFGSDAPL